MLVTLFNLSQGDRYTVYYVKVVEDLSGSTLLQTVDKFALNNHNVSHPITSDNIGMYCIYDNIVILNYSGTCLSGHLDKAITSLIQPHPVGPKQPQCIKFTMECNLDKTATCLLRIPAS